MSLVCNGYQSLDFQVNSLRCPFKGRAFFLALMLFFVLATNNAFAGGRWVDPDADVCSAAPVNWSSGSLAISSATCIPATSANAVTVNSGASVGTLTNAGEIGRNYTAPYTGLLNNGTINMIVNGDGTAADQEIYAITNNGVIGTDSTNGIQNNGSMDSLTNNVNGIISTFKNGDGAIINSIYNYGQIGNNHSTVAIDNTSGSLIYLNNYGTILGTVNLSAINETHITMYGLNAKLNGDLSIVPGSSMLLTMDIGNSSGQTANFTTQGNIGSSYVSPNPIDLGNSSALTNFNVNAGSTLNISNGNSIYATSFVNSGTVTVAAGSIGTIVTPNNYSSDGAFPTPHTITTAGTYTQSGKYLVGINGSNYGKLVINGPVTFQPGSSIGINPGSTVKGKTTYSGILTASSITGTPTTSSGAYKQGYATYGYTTAVAGNQVNLTTDAGVATTVDPPRANQANTIIQLSMISNQPVEDRMNWMVGKAYQGTTLDNHAWITPYGSWGKQSDHQSAYTQNILGIAMGADNNITPDLFVGGALMVGNSRLGGIDQATQENFSAKNYQATVYGKYLFDETWHAKAYVTVGTNRSTLNRYDEFAFMPASANVNSMYGGIYTGIEKHFSITPNQKFIPSIIVNYTKANVAGYTDSIGNTVQSQTAQSLITGGSAMYQINFDDYDRLQIKAGAGYDSMTKQSILQSTTADGLPVTLVGITPSGFIYNTGISYQRTVERDTYVSLGYYYMGSTGYQANILSATYKRMF